MHLRPSLISELVSFHNMEVSSENNKYIQAYTHEEHMLAYHQDNTHYLTVIEAGECIGFIILVCDEQGIEFRRIVITQKGSGLGQSALLEMEKYCLAHFNEKRIWLDVFDYNLRGIHIYEKSGYKRVNSVAHPKGNLFIYEKNI